MIEAGDDRTRQPARHGRVSVRVLFALVGTAILMGTLIWLAVPEFQLNSACEANLKSIWAGVQMYQSRYGLFPPSLHSLVEEGFSIETRTCCPREIAASGRRIEYGWVAQPGPQLHSTWPLAFDATASHTRAKRFVLYASGDLRKLTEGQFTQELARCAVEYKSQTGQDLAFDPRAGPAPPTTSVGQVQDVRRPPDRPADK